MSYKSVDLPLLNDLAWHCQQVKRITSELFKNNVSAEDIQAFLAEFYQSRILDEHIATVAPVVDALKNVDPTDAGR